MGISASNRVQHTFLSSPTFDSSCNSVFNELISLSHHTTTVLPYQLYGGAVRLHTRLLLSFPSVKRWAPSPPSQDSVDKAYRSVATSLITSTGLAPDGFKAFALELFTDAVVSSAKKEMAEKVALGVAGIAGVGMAGKVHKDLIGAVVGVYALGLATYVYISLA